MKRLSLFAISFACILNACDDASTPEIDGCPASEFGVCGDGILACSETCDGDQFADNLNIRCENGAVPDLSKLKCTTACTLNTVLACGESTLCGNNLLDPGEQCDGSARIEVTASCESPDMTKLSCRGCRLSDGGVCPPAAGNPQIVSTCGNGVLDEGEICDGSLIRESAKACPANMILKNKDGFACLDSCRLLDISGACIPQGLCGNGDLDSGEACDGSKYDEAAVSALTCPSGKPDPSKLSCTPACAIDASSACPVSATTPIFSEIVPALKDTGTSMTIAGLALELTNMGSDAADMSSCALHIYNPDGSSVKEYALSKYGAKTAAAGASIVICSQADKSEDYFGGKCSIYIDDDPIQKNISGAGYMSLECGGKAVDILNLNSVLSGIQQGAVDFIRFCDAPAITNPSQAVLGDDWSITAINTGAPAYGLGDHCSGGSLRVDDCKYTVSTDSITHRDMTVSETLEIKIPGLTDKTASGDPASSMSIEFVAGLIKDDGSVEKSMIHLVKPTLDKSWTNSSGFDRYTGSLRVFDTYDGFLEGDAGRYVFDAAVSFDNGKSWTYCGPKGIVSNYDAYKADERNTVDVSFDASVCGDGVITGAEVCDTGKDGTASLYLEQALVCDDSTKQVTDRSKLKCYSCTMLSTASACSTVPKTCGNKLIESGEVCDSTNIPDEAKVCPKGLVLKNDPVFECMASCAGINTALACENPCGNGRLDDGEACDGDILPETAKVCPERMVPKASPEYKCNISCSGIETELACMDACGNEKLEDFEVCDGSLISHERAAALCKKNTAYDSARAVCSACNVSPASCVPTSSIVFDEYLVHTNASGKVDSMAITINYYGTEPLDATHCSMAVLDKNGKLIHLTYYSFPQIAGTGDASYIMNSCKPLTLCSVPTGNKTDYETHTAYYGNCDATASAVSTTTGQLIENFFIAQYNEIDKLQITCGGTYIDYFDFAGLREAAAANKTHGKRKSSDLKPWPDRTSSVLSERMDLDSVYDLSTFAHPTCE